MAGLRSPLSTLRRHPHGRHRMTRGQGGSLFLSCVELSSTTLRQSPVALSAGLSHNRPGWGAGAGHRDNESRRRCPCGDHALSAHADFFDPARHGFVRVAVAVPRCRVADPAFNAAQTVALLDEAAAQGTAVVAFPELGLSAYTCDDLFHQRALLDACLDALAQVAASTRTHATAAVV